ncbi:MAG: Rieske 2Fe-2S domain-containing protein [Candidatus Marinimicrobia bacterium]|nr:Rieske 2Fe-2S domain-containing protein [Candidatus Neomarinimicrobiota bacterium]
MNKVKIADWNHLKPLEPADTLVENVDLVITRWADQDQVSVFYGRYLHRGAPMADGHVAGQDLIWGLHGWDYNYKTGISSSNPEEQLHRFSAWIEDGQVWVDEDELSTWQREMAHLTGLTYGGVSLT